MPMKPGADEDQDAFMERCMSDMTEGHDQDQAVAICMNIWRERSAPGIERRDAKKIPTSGFDYVLSDDTVDRHGTVLSPDGWDLNYFRKNNVAFFNHNNSFPIGTWENIRVEGKKLIARLKLAEEGTSDRIDEIIRLVRQGILKAASVGFKPRSRPERQRSDGPLVYKAQELLEASIVGVGSNSNALVQARSMNISPETMSIVFGEQAIENTKRGVGVTAGHGSTSSHSRKTPNMSTPIAQRIETAQTKLTELRDQLTTNLDIDEPDETALAVREELNGKVASAQRNLESLEEAERQLSTRSIPAETRPGTGGDPAVVPARRAFAQPAEKLNPADHVLRALVGMVVSHALKNRKTPEQVIAERYGQEGRFDEGTRVCLEVAARAEGLNPFEVAQRAATAPATTTTSGWASQLVETAFNGFMDLLMPASAFPGLRARGLQLTFGRAGVISIPTRLATPTVAGSFVAEGGAIPVRQGAFSSQTFTPKKMAVITSFTREIAEHSNPSIEALLRNAIQEDTSVALDTVLLDATAASTTRPAGIRNGVTVTTATAGGGFAALVGDMKALVAALITGSNGNIRAPVWIMNPIQALSISMTQNAGGDFPFAAEINNGRFNGYPVVLSANMTAGRVVLVDAADFITIEGGAPRFDMSDQAVLVYDDTAPAAVGTTGSPAVVGAPARSLWQTDSLALRMIMDVNWGMRRTGVVAWTDTVTW